MKNPIVFAILASAGVLFSGPSQSDTLRDIAIAAATVDRNNPAAVMEIQGQLRSIGLYGGPIDGLFGRGTYQAAVEAVAAVNAAQGGSSEGDASGIAETLSSNAYGIGAADFSGAPDSALGAGLGGNTAGGGASTSSGPGGTSGASGGAATSSGPGGTSGAGGGASTSSGPGGTSGAGGGAATSSGPGGTSGAGGGASTSSGPGGTSGASSGGSASAGPGAAASAGPGGVSAPDGSGSASAGGPDGVSASSGG